VAVGCVVVALLLSMLAAPLITRTIFVLLWPAVIFTAWFGGFGPALVTTVLGVLSIDYFVAEPRYRFMSGGWGELAQVSVFALASVVIAGLAAKARLAQHQQQITNEALERANEEMQVQSEELEQTLEESQALNQELEATNQELGAALEMGEDGRIRLAFLAHASEVLSSSLDYPTTLRQVAELAIERLADWCAVEINDAQGRRISRVVAHRDPSKLRWADEIDARYPADPEAPTGGPAVFRTGRSELYPQVSDEMLTAAARDEEHLRILREIGFTGGIVVPVVSRERILGTLTFVSAESGRIYTQDDLVLAEDLGRRAGTAIDNAELLREAERATDRARRLQAFAAALNEAATLDAVAEVSVVHGFDALGADAGSLALLAEDGQSFHMAFTRGYPPELAKKFDQFPVEPGKPLSDAVLSGVPRILANRAEMQVQIPQLVSVLADSDTAAFVSLPVMARGTALGGLAFSFREEQQFDPGIAGFLETLGDQAGQALERARLLESERAARETAEAANRAKSEFLSAMSHELRTPLNAIGGFVDLIVLGIRGPVSEQQREDLERVRRAQQHLLGLVTDILNFARIEAGRIEYNLEPVPLGPLLVDLSTLIQPQMESRGLRYDCPACDAPWVLRADPERTRQILLNVLANAAKFTDTGEVRVWAEATDDTVSVHISDTGRGIPAERIDSIFEPFVQLDRNLTPSGSQGVGLGLAISRDLAAAMGGTLKVHSEPEQGSTFVLTLPREKGE
jgi:signal transduction histidine kinase